MPRPQQQPSPNFPLRHLSVRVPWHDAAWKGVVCNAPRLNGACAKLKGIAEKKNDALQEAVAGRSLEDIPTSDWPACVDERGTFMAPFETSQVRRHALARQGLEQYRHFKPTPQRFGPFSAGIVPYRWMMRETAADISETLGLDFDLEREPELGYKSNWVHEAKNQTSLLNGFAGHLQNDASLYFVYAKHVPFIEGTARVLMGVGRVSHIGALSEYQYEGSGMRGMIWERPVQHSIRPNQEDGFLFPYLGLIDRAVSEASIDLAGLTARVPDEHWDEFSYGSEHVTHDGAIGALLALEKSLLRVEAAVGIATLRSRNWIQDELTRLWQVRGPYPGFGAVMTAFGFRRGLFVAHALQTKAGENEDPWPLINESFEDPQKFLPKDLHADFPELRPTWKKLGPERKAFLRLLSRFELTAEQAAILYEAASRERDGWASSDKEILQNPYRIFEVARRHPSGVRLGVIDRGVFPNDVVRLRHPLDAPSALQSPVDHRRIRGFAINVLEEASDEGHTLLPFPAVLERVADTAVSPALPVTGDILAGTDHHLKAEITTLHSPDGDALQLNRYNEIGELIRKNVEGRIAGKRISVTADWSQLLNEKFGRASGEQEKDARREKEAALRELAESRFTVLAGPAGAGKTTILSILCSQSEIHNEGVLLLAPTGKARVRMQELAGAGSKAYTIAQFLSQYDRYDALTGQYLVTGGPKATGLATVIVDEASMLTEEMLGALFDAVQGVKRFVLVGDPAQLPPIGAGRPFADIIVNLRPDAYSALFPRVAKGYAELTIERRQVGRDRPDLRLARWFSTSSPAPGEDDVFNCKSDEFSELSFVEWTDQEDFQKKLTDVVVKELGLADENDVRRFNKTLGSVAKGEHDYFNATRGSNPGSVSLTEKWQILSPVRSTPFGVGDINRQIHERYRAATIEFATSYPRSIPKPMGAERIVYGDKVINLRNHRRKAWPNDGGIGYIANGEIGIAVGQWATRKSPSILHVEFSSQQGLTYSFFKKDFTEEGDPLLELAYALTVHKAQGSQFELVILVLPEAHPILSRELVYTALTRHQRRVVIMHQGPRSLLKDLASPHRSETARRRTNLLHPSKMVEIPLPKGSVFLQEGLIHRTSRGLAVRSKSELIIANALAHAGVEFEYEKAVTLGGKTRYPDFTIEDEISGRTFYWEHLGLLERDEYREGWQRKLHWYQENGVRTPEDGGGANGTLITTTESSGAGFDTREVDRLITAHLR